MDNDQTGELIDQEVEFEIRAPEISDIDKLFEHIDRVDQLISRDNWYNWVQKFVTGQLPARPSHELFFMAKAMLNSRMTNCPKAGHGAVIVINHTVVSDGYNGVPRGVGHPQHCPRQHSVSGANYAACAVPCLHAETNAIYNAARLGARTEGATLYVTGEPCLGCAEAIIQAGITMVNFASGRSIPGHSGLTLLYQAGVTIQYVQGERS